jgi:methylated-DNA-[protein]-cysteine S-methyltransferase
MFYTYTNSPAGQLLLAGDGESLALLHFCEGRAPSRPDPLWRENPEAFREVIRQLQAYFARELFDFDLKLSPAGTPFQLSVWRALRDIPYGETISYGELARRLGNPNASRAVGLANGANPISIIVPCHRVIGSSGKLTGYGGGLPNKQLLLALEREGAGQQPLFFESHVDQ